MLFSVLATPKLRTALGQVLAGEGSDVAPDARAILARQEWLREAGAVDTALLRATADALGAMRSADVIVDLPRIEDLPADGATRSELAARVVRLAFSRLGPRRRVSEPEVNAAIAMFVRDYAFVRRDAVDAGVLARTADGSRYWLA